MFVVLYEIKSENELFPSHRGGENIIGTPMWKYSMDIAFIYFHRNA